MKTALQYLFCLLIVFCAYALIAPMITEMKAAVGSVSRVLRPKE